MNRRRFLLALAATPVAVVLARFAPRPTETFSVGPVRVRPLPLKEAFARGLIPYVGGPPEFWGIAARERDFNGRDLVIARYESGPNGWHDYIATYRYRLTLDEKCQWLAEFNGLVRRRVT